MKICLVAAFPPSGRQLNQYCFHIAREIQRHPHIELTILADELADYTFATDAHGDSLKAQKQPELPGFQVIRCWKVGSLANPVRLLRAIHRLKPDVVWFNLVFSTFGTPENPLAAFAGLSVPALTRAAGYYTHITLHQLTEHVDLSTVVRREKIYRVGTNVATRALLKAHSVSVLLSAYRRTLMTKYSAQNVLLGTHGIFTTNSTPPDFTKRGNPDLRILAFGHWGTYKRLETLMAAFPSILKKVPNARLIVAGGNHPTRAGYWESIRRMQPPGLPIEFRGYIPQQDVAELFCTSSVLVMPYTSATGSSGPAHQACEYGVPIVCADISDFRCMAVDDDMAINFYKVGDTADLAEKLVAILRSPELERYMAEHNYQAGIQMTMASVVGNYLRWFELNRCKRAIAGGGTLAGRRQWLRSWSSRLGRSPRGWTADPAFLPKDADGKASLEGAGAARTGPLFSGSAAPPSPRKPHTAAKHAENDGYHADPELDVG